MTASKRGAGQACGLVDFPELPVTRAQSDLNSKLSQHFGWVEIKYQCASLGAAVPSDQVRTGIMNSVIGSGAPRNCGFNITGEPGKSAPHDLGSVSGT